MPVPLFTNNATGTLAGSYGSGATALTLTGGQGIKFPSPTGGDWFMATIVDVSNNIEIVKVTARATDTLTVVRGQEGTIARALGSGEKIDLRITAGVLASIRDKAIQTGDIAALAVTTAKLADDAVTDTKIADGAIAFAAQLADGVVTAIKLATGAALANLGFTPVQQGGGAGQTANKIYFGWSEPKLRAQVDATDYGFILGQKDDGSVASAGYRGLPFNQQEANYQFGLSDGAGMVYHGGGGTHTYTIPTDTTPFGAGMPILVVNDAGALTIAPAGGVTLVWSPSGATGSRTLAANAAVTLLKVTSNRWYISGTGVT